MMGFYGDWGWGQWIGMALSMLVTWGLVAWLLVVAVAAWNRSERRHTSPDARRTLDERFAMGDITEDQYLRALDVLNAHPAQSEGEEVGT